MRLTKRLQWLFRQTEALHRRAEAETARRRLKPARPLQNGRAELWRWYQQSDLSWARYLGRSRRAVSHPLTCRLGRTDDGQKEEGLKHCIFPKIQYLRRSV